MVPGDDLGKVTRLKYIDDVSDDDLILYYFTDGTKCSSEFIADLDDENPIRDKKVMVTLAGPDYQWILDKKEVVDEESPRMKADDGIVYEAPTPGTHLGGYGQNRTVEKTVQPGIRIEVRPPRKPAKISLPPIEDFLLSLHPELEYEDEKKEANFSAKNTQSVPPKYKKPASRVVKEVEEDETDGNYTIEDFDEELSHEEAEKASRHNIKTRFKSDNSITELIPENLIDTRNVKIENEKLFIDIDKLSGNDESFKAVMFRIDGKDYELSATDLLTKLTQPNLSSASSKCIENEDILIKSMIDKSKKKTCKITMGITLELPPREVYDTIKTVYAEGMAEQFVKSLTARIPQDSLLNSLANGLASYYNNRFSASKTTTNK